jgi:hypothetical protein
MRAEECGKSKCSSVMEEIGIEPPGDIIPRESGPTSARSSLTREVGKPTKEAKQMAAEKAGAASHEMVEGWHDIDWRAAHQNVRRLQSRIVKATRGSASGAR